MTLVLAMSLVPSVAWAKEDSASMNDTESAVARINPDAEGAGQQSSGDASAQESSKADAPSGQQSGGSESPKGDSLGNGPSEANAGGSIASSNVSGEETKTTQEADSGASAPAAAFPMAAPAVEPAPSADGFGDDGVQPLSAASLDPDGYVYIEKQKGSGYSGSPVTGSVAAGTTLWANAYDYWDDWYIDGTFAYQWYSGAAKSVEAADYTPIAGATSQSFTIDADFAKAHDGEYLLVTVSDGKTTLTAPTSTGSRPQIAGTVKITSIDFTNGGVQYLMEGAVLGTRVYPSDAEPTFVWEKSTSKTGPFEVIEGATESTLELTEDLVGCFLRVTATTGTTSKQKATSFAVAPKGSWLVDEVKLTDTIGAYTGTTLTAQAYGRNAENVSKVAIGKDDVVFTWQYADSNGYGATWSDIPGATGRGMDSYTVGEAYADKYIRAQADANIASWVKQSNGFGPIKAIPQLASIDFTANGKAVDFAVAGDTVAAMVLDKNGQAVTDNLTYTWEIASSENGPFAPIADASGASYAVPEHAAGSYIRLTATGIGEGNAVERTFTVYAPDSLEAVVNALIGYVPVPNSDKDVSLAVMVEKKIAELGFEGVSVSLASTSDENVVAPDGVITGWFYADPSTVDAGSQNCNSALVSFSLSKDGDSVKFVPGENGEVKIGWDRARVRDAIVQDLLPQIELVDYLNKVDSSLDEITKYTKDLPTSAGWTNVTWESSNDGLVEITDDPYALVNQLERKELAEDAPVTITAKFATSFSDADGSAIVVEKPFDCVIKKFVDVSSLTSNDLKELLDKHYTIGKLTDFATGEPIDASAVTGDVQLPIPRDLFVEAHELSISVSSSDENVVKVNGYRAYVYRPIDGQDRDVTLSVTLARKDKTSIKASITIDLTVKALDLTDIDAEIALMEDVKASYADGIKGENASIDSITKNMESFQEVYRDKATGELVWVRDHADVVDYGIVPDELDGWYDSQTWRCFRSSDSSIVSHENLLVTQPALNTKVTVTSVLTSEVYGKYYELYKDDPSVSDEFKAKLASLYRQPVSCTVTVRGITGQDDPAADKDTIAVSVAITGVSGKESDGTYTAESWVPRSRVTAAKGQNVTAWNCFSQALDEDGYVYATGGGLYPYSITSPEGRTLTTIRQGSTKNSYWAFYINGAYADIGTTSYEVKDGDLIELRYIDNTGSLELDSDAVETNLDAPHPDLGSTWAGHANGSSGAAVEDVATPTEIVDEAAWKYSVLTEAEKKAGAQATVSDPLIIGGNLYMVSGKKTIDPNTGKVAVSKAQLSVVDPAKGETIKSVELAAPIDSTCRPAYADGIIVIPLTGGYLQAVAAESLETIWVTSYTEGLVSVSTLTIADGCVYASAAEEPQDIDGVSEKGVLYCYDLYTGDRIGRQVNESAGYYWTGGVKTGDYFIVPDDAGYVTAYSADLKTVVSKLKISDSSVRSSLIVDGDTIYAISKDGVLHRLQFGETGATTRSAASSAGQLVEVGLGLKFAQSSTSTPTIANGMLFVGGLADDGTGSLSVVDLDGWAVLSTVPGIGSTSSATAPSVQCAPLVSVQEDGIYVYFTSNRSDGGVYLYKVGDDTWQELFVPEGAHQNYCLSSIVCGPDGTLYYTNDSGTLFALRTGSSKPVDPVDPVDPEVPGNPGDSGASGLGDGNAGNGAASPIAAAFGLLGSNDAAASGGSDSEGAKTAKADSKNTAPRSETQSAARALGADAGAAEASEAGGLNWLAVGGIAVGVIALVCIGWFVFGPRKKREQ